MSRGQQEGDRRKKRLPSYVKPDSITRLRQRDMTRPHEVQADAIADQTVIKFLIFIISFAVTFGFIKGGEQLLQALFIEVGMQEIIQLYQMCSGVSLVLECGVSGILAYQWTREMTR